MLLQPYLLPFRTGYHCLLKSILSRLSHIYVKCSPNVLSNNFELCLIYFVITTNDVQLAGNILLFVRVDIDNKKLIKRESNAMACVHAENLEVYLLSTVKPVF